jgi:adhesin transport system outer membrane protein
VRWTLSTGGAEVAQRRAATADLSRARAEREDARASVHVDVVTAYRRLETARLRRAATRSAIEQARERQRIVRDRFDAGMAPVNDVLRASTDLFDAQANDVAARVDALVGAAALARAVGRAPGQ